MYEQFDEFYAGGGMGSPESLSPGGLAELVKALQAGSGAGLSSTGGRALVLEDLEGTLRNTTFGEKQFNNTLWSILKGKTTQATGIMHEFTKIQGYGETGAFSPEVSTTLQPIDVDLARGYAQVKFARNKRQVAKVLYLTKNSQNAESLQVLGGTRFLISAIEQTFYNGDSAMVAEEFDGLRKTAIANNTFSDLAGAKLSAAALQTGALNIANAAGVASHMFHPLELQQSLDTVLIGSQDRIQLNAGGQFPQQIPLGYAGSGSLNNAVIMGDVAAGFRTSYGNIMFRPHRFARFRNAPYTLQGSEVATSVNAPATPTTLATAVASQTGGFAGSGTGGVLASGTFSGVYAGTYNYRVSSENSAGESLACTAVTATVTSGQKATLTWDHIAGATCYRIYRSKAGGGSTDMNFIARVADTGSPTYVDTNQNIAGCFNAYMLDLDSPGELATLAWAQLAPMSRDMLPAGDTTIQWLQFIYGVLTMYAPLKMWMYRNCGIY